MLFSSTIFLFLFLPAVLIGYNLPVFAKQEERNIIYKNIILLLASLLFYAWGEPFFVMVMIVWIIINWGLGIGLNKFQERRRIRKSILVIAIILDVSLLFVFKYLCFLVKTINGFARHELMVIPNIALPIGISFFVFQIMSFIFDIYYGKCSYQKNPINLMLYVSMFPQLIAGPIVRYNLVEAEIKNRKVKWTEFADGVSRFIIGLSKKVILSNNLAIVADRAFAELNSGTLTLGFAWLGAIAYTLQIYYDFSGYSDMAIGLGKMFGFHFEENFNYPYIANSITEFWRRWHISLSGWFRDYVYIPLGGNKVSRAKHIRNLFVVWLLTGIWHGANWTFILWGLVYFIFLVIEKYTVITNKLGNVISRIYTMLVVVLCWVIFRSNSVAEAFKFIGSMFGFSNHGLLGDNCLFLLNNYKVFLVISIIGCTPLINHFMLKLKNKLVIQFINQIALILMFLISVSYLLRGTYSPFIYFNF